MSWRQVAVPGACGPLGWRMSWQRRAPGSAQMPMLNRFGVSPPGRAVCTCLVHKRLLWSVPCRPGAAFCVCRCVPLGPCRAAGVARGAEQRPPAVAGGRGRSTRTGARGGRRAHAGCMLSTPNADVACACASAWLLMRRTVSATSPCASCLSSASCALSSALLCRAGIRRTSWRTWLRRASSTCGEVRPRGAQGVGRRSTGCVHCLRRGA